LTLLSLAVGLTGPALLFAQDDAKKDTKPADTKKDEAPKPAEAKKEEPAKPAEAKKDEAAKPAETKKDEAKKEEPKEAPLPSIPPDVEAKLEKARRAVAEAIVAAQDAGLVETTVSPPPVLDILITGRATDARQIKNHTGVSPEVFAAWFTGFGKLEGFTAQKDVRIVNPSDGLTEMYTQRASVLERHIKAVRDAKGGEAKKDEPKKDDAKKEEPKKEEPKKEEPKKEEPKKEEAKKEEAKKEEAKKDDAKKDDAKKDEPKSDDAKKDEPKKDEPKSDETKKD
jgi:hypothetical protein